MASANRPLLMIEKKQSSMKNTTFRKASVPTGDMSGKSARNTAAVLPGTHYPNMKEYNAAS